LSQRRRKHGRRSHEIRPMLRWAIIFFVISLVAGALGFTGIAAGAARIAWILFGLFLLLALLFLILALFAAEAVL
jgi:uncharacterized membrane protein YtjA (UPF0391 family)